MKIYWVSAIIQNEHDKKAWLCAMTDGVLSLDKAMEVINKTRENHKVLSAWIDVFDENKVKQTIFHECYINVFGDLMKKATRKNGRPKIYSETEINSALKLLETHSYAIVTQMTGISKSTLIRAKRGVKQNDS